MCMPTGSEERRLNYQKKPSLLLSSSSFVCCDDKGEKLLPPSIASSMLTIVFIVVVLAIHEMIYRVTLNSPSVIALHPVLEVQHNRHILARHIAVDSFSCFIVAYLGYKNRHLLKKANVFTLKRNDDPTDVTGNNRDFTDCHFHRRLYQYVPEGQQVLLFFFAYQVKNMYDTIVWNDGLLFVLHHIFAGATAWFGMYPGVAGIYALFFMGLSEISTCILCLLANFDPDLGVTGLDEAFPSTRIVLATVFVVLFILCRIILWPICAYNFVKDCRLGLSRDHKVYETRAVKNTLKFMLVSVTGLTLLQILWLGEIFVMGKQEIIALMDN